VSDRKVVEQLLKEYPQSPKTVLAKFAKTTGKTLSQSTLRRIVKQSKLCWKRARKSLKHKRSQQEFETAKKELQKLKKQQKAGKIKLICFILMNLVCIDILLFHTLINQLGKRLKFRLPNPKNV